MSALAKTDRQDPSIARSLVGHSLDVANCAHAMLTNGVCIRRLEPLAGIALTDVHVARLCVLIGLHDFGKANRHFQNRLRGLQPQASHLAEAIAGLTRADLLLVLEPALGWCEDPDEMLVSIIGHHGAPVPMDSVVAARGAARAQWEAADDYNPVQEVKTLLDTLLAVFPDATRDAVELPPHVGFWHAVAGLTQVADWMGSDTNYHPLLGPDHRPRQAQALLDATGWSGFSDGDGNVMGDYTPNDLQQALLSMPIDPLVICEAPTGEGKSEAALCWFSRLRQAGLVDGLYFAVPTRSAATELFERISTATSRAFPGSTGRCALAVPGEMGPDIRDPLVGPMWALGGIKRVMGASIVVGTVDQTMLTVLRNPHAWLRAWCLTRHLLVIDEVHASDAYMSEVIAEVVRAHHAAGGYALLMSATLGEELAHRFCRRPIVESGKAIDKAYPLVTPSTGSSVAVSGVKVKTIRPRIEPHSGCLAEAVRRVARGHTVLWVRSTVTDALADFDHFAALGVKTMLHHSRYAACDRKHLDAEVRDVMGKQGHRRPMVIVSTQTCEQSLDIDADMLVTDACPADVFLQRCGRTGRFRTGYVPDVLIVDPLSGGGTWEAFLKPDGGSRGVHGQGWGFVYSILPVRSTLDWVAGRESVTVPSDSRAFVEGATHSQILLDAARRFGPQWEDAWKHAYGRDSAARNVARASMIDRSRSYSLAICDGRNPTRLGTGNVEVEVLSNPIPSPFGAGAIRVMPMRLDWLARAGLAPEVDARVVGSASGESVIEVSDGASSMRLTYGRRGLHRA